MEERLPASLLAVAAGVDDDAVKCSRAMLSHRE